MSNVERLLTQPERDLADKAQIALDALREVVDALPATVTFPAILELQKVAAPRQRKPKGTSFVMLTPETVIQTVQAIRDLPGKDRPGTVSLAFMACVGSLDWDNGRILRSQEELAKVVGVSTANLSRAMDVLVRMGVIQKAYVSGQGTPGRRVLYSINPHVAWQGKGHEAAKAAHPRPRLVRSTKPPPAAA